MLWEWARVACGSVDVLWERSRSRCGYVGVLWDACGSEGVLVERIWCACERRVGTLWDACRHAVHTPSLLRKIAHLLTHDNAMNDGVNEYENDL